MSQIVEVQIIETPNPESMKFQINITLLTLCVCFNGFAQIGKADVLFTVDKTPVYASEFVRVYNKNLNLVQDESQKNIDEYLELYTNYKLIHNPRFPICQ